MSRDGSVLYAVRSYFNSIQGYNITNGINGNGNLIFDTNGDNTFRGIYPQECNLNPIEPSGGRFVSKVHKGIVYAFIFDQILILNISNPVNVTTVNIIAINSSFQREVRDSF